MAVNLTCTQVNALLSFYLNDKLNYQLKSFVEAHLDDCPTCRAKFEALKDMVSSLREVHEKILATPSEEDEILLEDESISPHLFPIKSPSVGVSPMVVSIERP